MRNTWKGLVVGALTGMAGGAVMDMAARAGRSAASLVDGAKERVPDATRKVKDATVSLVDDAMERVSGTASH